ncbi:hypothetical protein SPRG_06362 [Saprolegnia parasitica CBS 223.65]|uniref:PH domain-containing protein n=1 Tax=Saprolegnia parasitica (strain CBS 223.65) TaxID=695850 RepID=A0A067CNC3_SAPPC|nr:hypothetical protein SPRG_06362 [Saprolegnia parasitica CBS 223.65]KDO28312.1 hypothetical protein SPRG_06362 [Saprolegnia parasitica CBS 223.65]|eukprot:XP_012201131.1 hypothetical protein SPRG_06362 [Saprolegnia parasitica CBS 223.65]
MNADELRAIRDALNARCATKQPWPLRIAKPVVALPPATLPPLSTTTSISAPRPPSPVRAPPVFERVAFCLRETINHGFGFLFDRIGNSMVVLRVVDATLSITPGSVLVSINGRVVDLDGTQGIIMDDARYPTDDTKREAIQLQMINLFKAHGVTAKTTSTCVATFVSAPILLTPAEKLHPRSRLQRWGRVFLKLECGYLNWFTTEEAAKATNVEMLQHSVVSLIAVHCDVAAHGDVGFVISEHAPVAIAPTTMDLGEASLEDDSLSAPDEDVDDEENANEDLAFLEAALPTSKYILPKRIIAKAPRSAIFRVSSTALRDEWLRQIRAAQSFRAEDFMPSTDAKADATL